MTGGAATSCLAGGVMAAGGVFGILVQDLSPVEKHGVLWLLSAVVLLGGGGGLKLLYDAIKAMHGLMRSVDNLDKGITTLIVQNQESHRVYAEARDRAVGAVTDAIAESEARLLREIERRDDQRRGKA